MGSLSIWHWLIVLLIVGGIGYAIYSSNRKSKRGESVENVSSKSGENLEGLNGWLILVGFGLVVTPIRLISNFPKTYLPFFTDDTLKALITPTSATYNAALLILVVIEIVVNIALFVATCVTIYLFFTKKKLFPKFFIILFIAFPLVVLIDGLTTLAVFPTVSFVQIFDPVTGGQLIATVIAGAIWISYMLRSRRVKLTFVN